MPAQGPSLGFREAVDYCRKTIPIELEECALIDGANRWQNLTKIVLGIGTILIIIVVLTLLGRI